jgi:hypothetical protein
VGVYAAGGITAGGVALLGLLLMLFSRWFSNKVDKSEAVSNKGREASENDKLVKLPA